MFLRLILDSDKLRIHTYDELRASVTGCTLLDVLICKATRALVSVARLSIDWSSPLVPKTGYQRAESTFDICSMITYLNPGHQYESSVSVV